VGVLTTRFWFLRIRVESGLLLDSAQNRSARAILPAQESQRILEVEMRTSPERFLPSSDNQTSVAPRQLQNILQSWKEIASELNRGVRTVQRWEQTLRLPVHRLGKGPRGRVFAFKDELHSWFRKDAGSSASELTDGRPGPAPAEWPHTPPIMSFAEDHSRAKRHSAKGRTPAGRTSKAQASVLRSINAFFAKQCSRQKQQRCKECRSALRFIEGRFSVYGTDTQWRIPIPYCPVCDGNIVRESGPNPTIN